MKLLNGNLYNEFSLEKLEERLETDPLLIATDLLNNGVDLNDSCEGFSCYGFVCAEYICGQFIS